MILSACLKILDSTDNIILYRIKAMLNSLSGVHPLPVCIHLMGPFPHPGFGCLRFPLSGAPCFAGLHPCVHRPTKSAGYGAPGKGRKGGCQVLQCYKTDPSRLVCAVPISAVHCTKGRSRGRGINGGTGPHSVANPN